MKQQLSAGRHQQRQLWEGLLGRVVAFPMFRLFEFPISKILTRMQLLELGPPDWVGEITNLSSPVSTFQQAGHYSK